MQTYRIVFGRVEHKKVIRNSEFKISSNKKRENYFIE